VTIEGAELDSGDMLVEFGAFKKAWRGWLDTHLDHALVIRRDDPVGDALIAVIPNQRLFRMEANPTTEAIAALLFEQAKIVLTQVPKSADCSIARVHVQETKVNAASYQL
jgi:6-pyruvoyltetrahydropterin/6-carboxytetrahydropterin synthase